MCISQYKDLIFLTQPQNLTFSAKHLEEFVLQEAHSPKLLWYCCWRSCCHCALAWHIKHKVFHLSPHTGKDFCYIRFFYFSVLRSPTPFLIPLCSKEPNNGPEVYLLANFWTILANLPLLWCTFRGFNHAAVYQNIKYDQNL